MIENIRQHSLEAAQGLKVRSALNPVLWLCAITSPTCFIAAYSFLKLNNQVFAFMLLLFGLLPVFCGCIAFLYFTFFKPEKLQSEEYQLKHQTLQFIHTKNTEVKLDTTSLERIIGNPPFNPNSNTLPPA